MKDFLNSIEATLRKKDEIKQQKVTPKPRDKAKRKSQDEFIKQLLINCIFTH